MGPVKITAMYKRDFIFCHGKLLVHVHYSRVNPAKEWGSDGDKIIECWGKTGKNDQRTESDNDRGVKLNGDRSVCG